MPPTDNPSLNASMPALRWPASGSQEVWQVHCCAAAMLPLHCERAGDLLLLGLRPLLLLLLGLRLLALAAGEPERAGDLKAEHARNFSGSMLWKASHKASAADFTPSQ